LEIDPKEALDDGRRRLDVFDGDRVGGLLDFEQPAEGAQLAVLFVD
jgi:hypothetical protein